MCDWTSHVAITLRYVIFQQTATVMCLISISLHYHITYIAQMWSTAILID